MPDLYQAKLDVLVSLILSQWTSAGLTEPSQVFLPLGRIVSESL